jgi:chromosomal replication initiation ATPase DnaA
MTYEHLADVFSRAYAKHRSIARALVVLDRYRAMKATHGYSDAEAIVHHACRILHVRARDLKGATRNAELVRARHVAMAGLRSLGMSYPAIGRYLGGFHHTSVMTGVQHVEADRELRVLLARVLAAADSKCASARTVRVEQEAA